MKRSLDYRDPEGETFYKRQSSRNSMGSFGKLGRMGGMPTTLQIVIIVLMFGIFLTFLNIWQLRQFHYSHSNGAVVEGQLGDGKQPIVWMHAKNMHTGYLRHISNVFERLGYTQGTENSDWDVLWAHDYPFTQLKDTMRNLKPHHKVNHFPGSGYITNKVGLATSPDIKHIPKAFKLPKQKEEFLEYSKEHPDYMWVQKGNNHRGVKIKSLSEIDYEKDDSFVQRYVDNPFLIDGKRFDLGLYVVLTSIDPLRVYMNEGDWLVRFCPHDYYPFDPTDKDKYVVSDDYLPVWQVPSFKKLFVERENTFKETLLSYLRVNGYNTTKFVNDIHEAIKSVYLSKEQNLITAAALYKSKRNFFEMVRFDFVVDKDLNIYLMEVNMSPNLSTNHFSNNKLLYEQTIYGMMTLVGVGKNTDTDYVKSSTDEKNMLVSERDIHIFPDICASKMCEDNCLNLKCKLCAGCYTEETSTIFKSAFMEHNRRGNWRRIVPRTFKDSDTAMRWNPFKDTDFLKLTQQNQFMALWFMGKCMQDSLWCK